MIKKEKNMGVLGMSKKPKQQLQADAEFGDLLIAYLEQLGVEYIFGVPGGAIEPFYNALARSERRGGPRAVIARHETGAAFMADGYARNTGKLGVCCATTGPGATNLITGVASAYENNIPMLVITAQTALSTFGRGAFQESSCTGTNTVGLFEYCTRYNTLVSHAGQFEAKLVSAIMTALQSPGGPVHLSVPLDIMRDKVAGKNPTYNLLNLLNKPSLVDDVAVKHLYEELINARNPVFLIGDEASEAIGTILSLAVDLGARILVTPHGKGLVSPYHPLFRGVIGFAGHQSARDVLSDPSVDLLVAIGATLGEWASDGWDTKSLLTTKMIHVESVEENFIRTPMAKLHVRGRLSTIFDQLVEKLVGEHRHKIYAVGDNKAATETPHGELTLHFTMDDPESYCSDATPIKPQRLMRELPKIFPPNTRYLADSGGAFTWATHYLHPYDRRIAGKRNGRGGLFRASLEFASMGWAIGSSVGTALAEKGSTVVCITGDGSMLMSGQEITVASQENLPVVFVILNDSCYGMVRHGQQLTGAEPIGYELPVIDFSAFARSMGIVSHVIHSPDDLLALDIDAICNRKGPTLLDIRIDPDEAPPMGMRTKALK
ncbi:thiamine pyrophosphate-binding protein [Porticoccus sp.]|uniref:thiamine pyrophosphate-binding protein n=1 Tax=Porticoccus sp. TaxID=2024853 RepID=UPI0025D07E2D|nr:thiamine pyrophosphate-binding protein [Porticoccus sp.]